MFVEENRQIVHMYEAKLVRIWDKIRKLEVNKKETQHFPHAQFIACPHAKIVEPVLKISKLVLSSTLLEH
jgi:hypothetical protein